MSTTGVHVRNRHGGASPGLATTRDTHSAHGITPSVTGISYADARSGEQSQTLDIAPGAVDGTVHIVQGSISRELFAGSLMFPVVVGVLPVLPDATYPAGSHVFLTTDKKLYRNDADVWVNDAAATNAFVAGVVTAAAIGVDELAANSIQTQHFQVGAYAPNVNNNPGDPPNGEVIIDSTGITILNGRIHLEDYSGLSVLTAAGFAGSWVEFIQHGLYNASFNAGADSSGLLEETWDDGPEYEDGLSTLVPGWVVDALYQPEQTYGLVTEVGGSRVLKVTHVVATSAGFREAGFYQDVPVVGGKNYEVYTNWSGTTPHASHSIDATVTVEWMDANHETLGLAVVGSSDSQDSITSPAGYVHFATGAAPESARFGRLYLHSVTTGNAGSGTITVSWKDVTIRPIHRQLELEIAKWSVLGDSGYHTIRAVSGSLPQAGLLLIESGNGVMIENSNYGATGSTALIVSDGGMAFTTGFNAPDVQLVRQGAGRLALKGNDPMYFEVGDNVNYPNLDSSRLGGGTLELRATTPYIDFSNDNAIDYDARLILDSDNQLTVDGANVLISGSGGYAGLSLYSQSSGGGIIDVGSGGVTDLMRFLVRDSTGSALAPLQMRNVSGSMRMGFYGAGTVAKPTVTGSRGGNAALTSLMTALANLGLVTNSTT